MGMREQLGLGKFGGIATTGSQPEWAQPGTPGTALLGFDVVRIIMFSEITSSGAGVGRFGPAPLFTVPESIQRRVVTRIGVSYAPEVALVEHWWWLTIGRGPVQEWITEGSTTLNLVPIKFAGGGRWAGFGTFDLPQDARVLLHPGAVLEINFGTEIIASPYTLNAYVRVAGYDETTVVQP